MVLAMAMQESDSMEKTDTSKHGGATNVSPFNMNFDELGMLGCDESCARGLGQYSGSYDISASIMWLLKGIRGGSQIGTTEDFLNYHRDGVTGWKACRGKGREGWAHLERSARRRLGQPRVMATGGSMRVTADLDLT